MINQCDGCRRGLPVENNVHIDTERKGWGDWCDLYMVCTKALYVCQYCESETECDCLDRINCPKTGKPLHKSCGLCETHHKPRFICGCFA